MAFFQSDGVRISYEDSSTGAPVLLIHGFASNRGVNWVDTGWVNWLTNAGHRAIAFDNRGHGESGKLYDPAQYTSQLMAEDARLLLDHLGIAAADVIGYSMGARIAARLAIAHPARVRRAVFAGLAASMIDGLGGGETVALGLEAPDIQGIKDPEARAFRKFAEQTKSDLRALAACMRASRRPVAKEELARITQPALVVAGELDDIAGPVEALTGVLPNARGLTLPGRNHMSAVGDSLFKREVTAFLS
jgi:pimeloyl-ACP methyl ester carboxylesterase